MDFILPKRLKSSSINCALHKLLSLALIFSFSNLTLAQKNKKKADKLFESMGYMASAKIYEQLEGEEMNDEVMARLATSYRLNGNYEDAEYWYSKLVQNTDDPVYYLHYAQMLQSNQKCKEAINWYKRYYDITGDDRRYYIQDCLELKDKIPYHKNIVLKNVADLNSPHMDFCAVPYGQGVVLTSSRLEKGLALRKDLWTQDHFCDLFYADLERDGSFTNVRPFNGDLNGKFHDGTPAFNAAGTYMIFTRNDKKRRSKDGIRDLKLYEANNDDGYWTNVQELPKINDDEFSCAHPSLSEDGRRLYFSSNRPGGFGGMDIYVSERVGGTWQEPVNLGRSVNSSGNEIFPFIAEDEQLYFSSNGHQGLGGLDLFMAQKSNHLDETTWLDCKNLGQPFNSEKDDVGFYINVHEDFGYFSSNRVGGFGEDDIYKWEGSMGNLKTENILERSICVNDDKTGKRLNTVDVTIIKTTNAEENEIPNTRDMLLTLKPLDDTDNEYVLSIIEKSNNKVKEQEIYSTENRGQFNYILQPEHNYIFVLEKEGYTTVRKTVSAEEILAEDDYCFTMSKKLCIPLNGIVKNKDYPALIPNAEVKVFNKCTGEIEAAMTDKNGKFDFCLECGCDYEIYATKPNFESEMTLISTLNRDCEALDMENAMVATIDMKVGQPNLNNPNATTPNPPNAMYPALPSPYSTPVWPAIPHQGENGIVYIPLVPPGYEIVPGKNFPPKQSLNQYFLGDSAKVFQTGQTIKLSNIYYDFDEFYIRKDAEIELNHVLHLLQTYPTMDIALIAHTDSRGSQNYNERLSRNRAKAAVKYLIKNGIDARRLVPVGLGEHRVVNRCANGVNCSENEHQQNRRTEIRILKLNEPGTRVIYDD